MVSEPAYPGQKRLHYEELRESELPPNSSPEVKRSKFQDEDCEDFKKQEP